MLFQVKNSRIAHFKQQNMNEELSQEIEQLQRQLEVSERGAVTGDRAAAETARGQ